MRRQRLIVAPLHAPFNVLCATRLIQARRLVNPNRVIFSRRYLNSSTNVSNWAAVQRDESQSDSNWQWTPRSGGDLNAAGSHNRSAQRVQGNSLPAVEERQRQLLQARFKPANPNPSISNGSRSAEDRGAFRGNRWVTGKVDRRENDETISARLGSQGTRAVSWNRNASELRSSIQATAESSVSNMTVSRRPYPDSSKTAYRINYRATSEKPIQNRSSTFNPDVVRGWQHIKANNINQAGIIRHRRDEETLQGEGNDPATQPKRVPRNTRQYGNAHNTDDPIASLLYGELRRGFVPLRRIQSSSYFRNSSQQSGVNDDLRPEMDKNGALISKDFGDRGGSSRFAASSNQSTRKKGDGSESQLSASKSSVDLEFHASTSQYQRHAKTASRPLQTENSKETIQPNRSQSRFREDQSEDSADNSRPRRNKNVDDPRSNARRGRQSRFAEEDDDDAEHRKSLRAERKRAKEEKKIARLARQTTLIPISLPEYISVSRLASALKIRNEVFLDKLAELGFEEPQNNHILNSEDAKLIAMEFNFQPTFETKEETRDLFPLQPLEDRSTLPSRPPVVTIMGHVDHGKTTILDFFRKSSITASEFGGITQHIGAFSVPLPSGKTITFLDTPGHAAFLNMRQRGANVTDIVVLVVAADDSVMPQTVEAIKHAQSARVPVIVAISKIDKEEATPDRVKSDLARYGVEVEDFGGDTQVVCVSGKTGQGMEKLEEAILTLSEILDHRAESAGQVEGWVLEASTKKSGRVATLLVRRGTLRSGDILVAGSTWTRVRCLRNDVGAVIEEAGPGMPVEVDGWRGTPEAGDEVIQSPDESKATSVVEYRNEIADRRKLAKDMEAINDARKVEAGKRALKESADASISKSQASDRNEQDGAQENEVPCGPQCVPLIVKADVSGSAEAVVEYISKIGNTEVVPLVIRSGVGAVTEFDVEHAAVAQGHIISFNCSIDPRISQLAVESGVRILDHNIIYRVVEDVKSVLSEKLKPIVVQRVTGEAEVAQIFSINLKGRKQMQIAGCKVRNGTITKGSKVRVLRGKQVIYDGTVSSLKSQKKDTTEMRKGNECGMGFEDWQEFQEGDQLQCYREEEEHRIL